MFAFPFYESQKTRNRRKLTFHTKQDIIDIVDKAKCPKLKGVNVDSMNKSELIDYLINVKCPELERIFKTI
jgi:hypothetical protein